MESHEREVLRGVRRSLENLIAEEMQDQLGNRIDSEVALRQVRKALSSAIRQSKYKRPEVLKAVGITEGAFDTAWSRRTIRLVWIYKILNFLKLDPVAFFARAHYVAPPVSPEVVTPEIVVARRRIGGGDSTNELAIDLTHLETLCQDRPRLAVEKARELVETVALEQLPRVLAFCGTAYRFLESYPEAVADLEQAQVWEQDSVLKADLNQRLGYVYAAQEEWSTAHQHLAAAQAEYLLRGLDSKVGETLVDRGMFLYHQNRRDQTVASLTRALDFLAPDAVDNLFTVYLGLALCGHEEEFNLARADTLPVGDSLRCKRVWFDAQRQERSGSHAEAFKTLVSLALAYLEIGQNLNACWAAAEAVRLTEFVQLDTSQLAEAIGRITLALPEDSRAGANLARLWIAVNHKTEGQPAIELLVIAVHQAVERERHAAW